MDCSEEEGRADNVTPHRSSSMASCLDSLPLLPFQSTNNCFSPSSNGLPSHSTAGHHAYTKTGSAFPVQYSTSNTPTRHERSPSPKAQLSQFASPSLVRYIRTAEMELDTILRETLDSPVRKFDFCDGIENTPQNDQALTDQSASTVSQIQHNLERVMTIQHKKSKDENNISKRTTNIDTSQSEDKKVHYPDDSFIQNKKNADEKMQRDSILKSLARRISIAFVGLGLFSILILYMGSIYPASPLLLETIVAPNERFSSYIENGASYYYAQCEHPIHTASHFLLLRAKLGMASITFALATSFRTLILAPLLRLREKKKSLQHSWSNQQISYIIDFVDSIAESMEEICHDFWEKTARNVQVLNHDHLSMSSSSFSSPLELDLDLLVPCDYLEGREYLLRKAEVTSSINQYSCSLRDIINRELLIEYATIHFDPHFNLATHPLILRNMWPPETFDENEDGDDVVSLNIDHMDERNSQSLQRKYPLTYRRLSLRGFMNDSQLSNLILPNYFSDASRTGYSALIPNSTPISLSNFIQNIISGETPHAKIGTQIIVQQYPDLREEIVPPLLAKELFRWNPWLEHAKEKVRPWMGQILGDLIQKLPPTSYYPIFIAGNPHSTRASKIYSRTDLHTEPIGNIAVQLHGARRWTLIPPQWSALLRPTVSKHGRGYYYSNLDPTVELPTRLRELPQVYECVTKMGDALWLPPWMWHRIDYDHMANNQGVNAPASTFNLSLGASVFHFYPMLYAVNFPLFAFLILPNMIWEALGFNIE